MNDKKKMSWIVWGPAALLLMLVAYPLSMGPVLALYSSSSAESLFEAVGPPSEDAVDLTLTLTYWPLQQLSEWFPNSIGSVLQAYVDWWAPQLGHAVAIPASAPLPAPPIPPPPIVESLSDNHPDVLAVDQPSSGLPISQ